jgi:PilZ domain-containing protein
MRSERHRAPRHSFVAGVDLTDLQSEKHLAAHIKNLNLLGCFVETLTPFPKGTKVRLKISHAGVNFTAIGKVAYSRPSSGMGIAFITIEPSSLPILDAWLVDLRK